MIISSLPEEIPPSLLVYPDVAFLHFLDNNLDEASTWINKSVRLFSLKYSSMADLNFNTKRNLLQELMPMTEVHSYLIKDQDFISRMWEKSFPGQNDNLVTWETIFRYRSVLNSSFESDPGGYIPDLRLKIAQSSLQQGNAHLALRLTEGYPQHEPQLPSLIQAKAKILRYDLLEESVKKLTAIVEAREIANTVLGQVIEPGLQHRFEEFQAYLCTQLIPILETWSRIGSSLPPSTINSLRKLYGLSGEKDVETVARTGLEHLKSSVQIVKSSDVSLVAEAYFHLSQYCNKWYSHLGPGVSEELTNAVLRSMQLGHPSGAALFPLVLREIKKDSKSADVFAQQIKSIPFHAYRKWTNQIISHLPQLPAVIGPLLVDLSSKYSEFLMIPFNVTIASLNSQELSLAVVKQLSTILQQDASWHNLMASVEYLLQPLVAASSFLSTVMGDPSTAAEEFKKFRAKYLNLKKNTNSSLYGAVHYKFSEDYTSKFDPIFRSSSVKKESLESLKRDIDSAKMRTRAGKAVLRDYSPWLANFKSRDFPHSRFPLDKDLSVNIYGVKEDFLILSSLRRPVRLTFIGDDAKEYPVLVKHNEDLRQDERIQQLFHIMNEEFQKNPDCHERQLRLMTYQVIPLSPKVGMVQWLNNTVTLKDLLQSDEAMRKSMEKALQHLKSKLESYPGYLTYYIEASREQIISDYESCCSMVSPLALRSVLKEITQSPEAFYFIRRQLATSHAVLCIAHWILGIGDRHLSNFLISMQTGDIIGIDFGCAFGLGTFLLSVPELVPCRLSPQFQNLITGLRLSGPIRETMILTLRTLSTNPDAIEAAMRIFVTEPTIDWAENSKRIANRQIGLSHNSAASRFLPWSPEEALNRAQSKLHGVNPAEVTCLDLRSNIVLGSNKEYISRTMDIITGKVTREHSKGKRSYENQVLRAGFPAGDLSVENQVDCIMDMAMDPALLGKMYVGWEPWV